MRTVLALALVLLATSGCFAVGAKVHGGIVRDAEGGGLQVGASLMFGYAGARSATVAGLGVAAGGAPTVGLESGFHHVRFFEDAPRLGMRAGIGGVLLGAGEPRPYGARLATLFVLRERSRDDPGHEKMGFGGSSRSVLAAGLEGMVGFAQRGEVEDRRTSLAGGAAVSLEWYLLNRMRL